jgi:TonB family protein
MNLATSVVVVALAGAALASAEVQQPRDPRRPPTSSGQSLDTPAAEAALRKQIAESPSDRRAYLRLAKLQEDRGSMQDAEATLLAAQRAIPGDKAILHALAGLYTRTGRFDDGVAVLQQAAQIDPTDPEGHHRVAVYYWEKTFRDKALTPGEQRSYILSGIEAEDRALAIDGDYDQALVYKNMLLRLQANTESDRAVQQRLIAEADALRTRAVEIARRKGQSTTTAGEPGMPPPPPPMPPPDQTLGDAPIRVGGNVKAPTKTKDVQPVYPEEAREARVQGVVILEVTVDTAGRVGDARVLRSIPLLDTAALDAVQQWEFEPTLLNGRPVSVIMTVTVNFALQ